VDEATLHRIAVRVASYSDGLRKAEELIKAVTEVRSDLREIADAEFYNLVPRGTADKVGAEVRDILSVPAASMTALGRETQRILSVVSRERARRASDRTEL